MAKKKTASGGMNRTERVAGTIFFLVYLLVMPLLATRIFDLLEVVLDTTITIGYDVAWRQVHAMLLEAAKTIPEIGAQPEPYVVQTALSDFYVDYKLVCQAVPSEPRPRAVIVSALHENIQDVFNENGVQIMSPHYLGDPAEPKLVPRSKWHAKPAPPA